MALTKRLQVVLDHLQTPVHPSFKKTSASQYVYTVNNNVLSEDQRAFYELNGYIVIPKLIEDELLDEFRARFVDICNGVVDKGGATLMKDISLMKTRAQGEFLYNRIQDINWDDVFSKYVLHPNIIKYVECFTGPDVTAVYSMLINKPPDSGRMTSVHPLHQDLYFTPVRNKSKNTCVASWTAMEKTTANNGCLFVIPGTHKSALQPHDYPDNEVNKAYYGVKGFDLVPRVNLEMEKGDTVFFHPLLMHGSGLNLTKGFRKAISCHYSSNNSYYIDVRGTMQDKVGREFLEIFKQRGYEGMVFEDIWRLRHRKIKGVSGPINELWSSKF